MAVIKMKPTSPGRRAVVKVTREHLHKGQPHAPLLEPQFHKAGQNKNGHIPPRHKGGGHKHHYRVVDFKRNKDGIAAKVERIEYDPNRTAHIALVCYADGQRRSAPAPRCRSATSPWVRPSTASSSSPVPARRSPARPAPRPRCWRAKAPTPKCACARARCARSTSNAAPPSARWPTKSTACANWAKPGSSAGWGSVPPCAASP